LDQRHKGMLEGAGRELSSLRFMRKNNHLARSSEVALGGVFPYNTAPSRRQSLAWRDDEPLNDFSKDYKRTIR
jgi:hypothetical protein